VIVVGGGIIGLACAWRLAQKGVDVTLFDAAATGSEASWAGAGMLAPGGEVEEDTPHGRMATASLGLWPEFVEELREASGVAIDYRACGAVEVALTEAEAVALEEKAALQAGMGIRSEACSREGAVAARFYPDDAMVNPREVTAALREACVRWGVEIREQEPVREILALGRGVWTTLGRYADKGVLLAAGAWSSRLWPGARESRPVRGHLVSYREKPGALGTILRHNGTYLLQRTNGMLIAGTTTEHAGFDRTLDEGAIADVRRRAEGLLPALAGQEPVERWNGFRPGVDGDVPVIERVPGTQVWLAYGHYRNGILLAPETARRVAALVPGEREETSGVS